jgi:hypothetical protein
MKLLDFKTFLFENNQTKKTKSRPIATTHGQFVDDIKRKDQDFATPRQEISSNRLMVGDFAIHKDKQSLGPGQIKKIINNTHATLHFNVDLESSLIDGPKDHETFTFLIADLIPIMGSDDT